MALGVRLGGCGFGTDGVGDFTPVIKAERMAEFVRDTLVQVSITGTRIAIGGKNKTRIIGAIEDITKGSQVGDTSCGNHQPLAYTPPNHGALTACGRRGLLGSDIHIPSCVIFRNVRPKIKNSVKVSFIIPDCRIGELEGRGGERDAPIPSCHRCRVTIKIEVDDKGGAWTAVQLKRRR